MAVNPEISILLDLYGDILTDKERDALDYYYNDDLSLKEIAENETEARRRRRDPDSAGEQRDSITRQGVRDTIKRAEAKLIDIDSKLRLIERAEKQAEALSRLRSQLDKVEQCNLSHGCYREIQNALTSARDIITELEDM